MIDELKKFVSELTEEELVFLIYTKHIPYFEFIANKTIPFETLPQIAHL